MYKFEIKKDGKKIYQSPYCSKPIEREYLIQFLENEGYEINFLEHQNLETRSNYETKETP